MFSVGFTLANFIVQNETNLFQKGCLKNYKIIPINSHLSKMNATIPGLKTYISEEEEAALDQLALLTHTLRKYTPVLCQAVTT